MARPFPKVLLFDIGGVCVVSPFQSILDYETSQGIPPGYINFSISRGAPNGSWQRLERGEIPLDSAFFEGFKSDLSQKTLWQEFHTRTARLSREHHSESLGFSGPEAPDIPDIPDIDAERLFWEMMTHSRAPDPHMFPALKRLKASGKFIIAALSNTVIFPPGHPLSRTSETDVRNMFDLFISSAHVGMRKPDPRVYDLTISKLKELARDRQISNDLKPDDIVFLDDIGENLKWGKRAGMRTIRVRLGKTRDAVRELEEATGMKLMDGHESNNGKPKL